MNKNYKRIFGYAIIMIVCVIMIVLVACVSENRLEGYQKEYNELATGSQRQIEILEDEIDVLLKQNGELKKKIEEMQTLESNLETAGQGLSDLKDIYEKYKSGNKKEAKAAFSKIEPIGFDDATLAYYELLKDFLK